MSGFENHLRQEAAKTRMEYGTLSGEEYVRRVTEERRRHDAEVQREMAKAKALLEAGNEMLRKLREQR